MSDKDDLSVILATARELYGRAVWTHKVHEIERELCSKKVFHSQPMEYSYCWRHHRLCGRFRFYRATVGLDPDRVFQHSAFALRLHKPLSILQLKSRNRGLQQRKCSGYASSFCY
jgi:hypothetical protein